MTRIRRYGPWVLLVLVAGVLAVLLSTPRSGERLSPANNGPDGAMALAEVLQDQGVELQRVEGTARLGEQAPGAGSTVLLPHTSYLGEDSGPALLEQLRGVDHLVVLVEDPVSPVGDVLGLDLGISPGSGIAIGADCGDPLYREGDRIAGWDVLLSAGGPERSEVSACYPPGAGHNAGGAREGTVLSYPATADRPALTVAGVGTSWTNARITEEANAAVALRLLGRSDTLVWVRPVPADAGMDAAASLWDVLPRNLTAAVWILAMAGLALALWQGRRLGAVVVEPLPAVVRATETTRSRGRLYRQAQDRGHALGAVRAGARHRIAPLLGLPRTGDPDRIVEAAARASGRPVEEVAGLLTGAGRDVPRDDAALVDRVRAIRELEDALAHPLARAAAAPAAPGEVATQPRPATYPDRPTADQQTADDSRTP